MKSKLYAVLYFLLAWFVRLIFRVSCKTYKKEPPVSDGGLLVCANHIAVLDPVLICSVLRKHQPRIMAKKELFSVPVLGWLITQLGAYPVDRKGANADVIFKTIKMLEDGYCVGMFPQGTRRADVDPATTPVKAGAGLIASKAKATVLPIHIKTKNYRIKAFRKVTLIMGDPIPYEEYTKGGELEGDSKAITQYIFDRIIELGKEEDK